MHTFEEYLIVQGFSKVDNIELLKITLSEDFQQDNKIFHRQDLRYYLQNNIVIGLHISGLYQNMINLWKEILSTYSLDLSKIKVLYLAKNNFKAFENYKLDFTNLVYLNLSQSLNIERIKLSNAKKLREFYAYHCPLLSEISLKGTYNNLEKIDISNCSIDKVNIPTNLSTLRYFNFTQNKLSNTSFLKFITKRKNFDLEYLFWAENPLPESLINTLRRNDIEVLKAYFGEDKDELITIFRKKLILLGNTQAGKTSLCDILLDSDKADGSSTHGVNIFTYEPEKDKVIQVFDFGGQDFYHNAHLSFYSINANYLLVYGNGQKDEYKSIPANRDDSIDDIFPKHYWLNSLNTNLRISEHDKTLDIHSLFQQKNIKLALLENLKENEKAQRLNQKSLEEVFVATEFWHYPLRKINGTKLENSNHIKTVIDQWLLEDIRQDQLRQDIKDFGEKLQRVNNKNAIGDKSAFLKEDGKLISEEELKLLHDSYYIFLCEAKDGQTIPKVLAEKVIVNLALFSQWIYAILKLKNLLGKGYFNKDDAEKWLVVKKYNNALVHLDFIIAFLLHEKMIFKIEDSEHYLVPQYLSEPQYPADKLLLKLFKTPFLKYQFTGFYHTQLLTNIIAKFFDDVEKVEIDKQYRHLIWKNKVILYLEKQTEVGDRNPANFLLIEFAIVNQEPTLSLSVLDNNDLSQRYEAIKKVIDFIDKSLQETFIKYHKLIKAPNNHYINAELLKEDNTDGKGNISDLIFDNKAKCFYRKGDFPLFVDPEKYPMKKIFISYSKSDVKYRDEFKKHFYPLKRQSLIDTFDDSDLGFGEWNSVILKKIEECDIFVCLVSIDFLNTSYIIDTELPHALKHKKEIVPIKIRDCYWSDFIIQEGENASIRLGQFNVALKAKAITLFVDKSSESDARQNTTEERDAIWTNVVKKFKEAFF